MGTKHIYLPFASEAQDRDSVDYPIQYRQYLSGMLEQHPELFPKDMAQGFALHDCYVSVKRDLIRRRIKVKATGAVFTPASECPQAHRTSNAVDRLLTSQDRLLYCHALLLRYHRQRAAGATRHGAAMELSPVWHTPAA